jgi:hypothetical protein
VREKHHWLTENKRLKTQATRLSETTALISLLAFTLFFFLAHQLSEIVQTNRKD